MQEIALLIFIGLVSGAAVVTALYYFFNKQILNEAKEEAEEILKEAKDQFEADELERKEKIQQIELEAWNNVEEEHLLLEQKCEELETKVADKKVLNEDKYKTIRASLMMKENELRDISIKLKSIQDNVNKYQEKRKENENNLVDVLLTKTQLNKQEVVSQIKEKIISETTSDYTKYKDSFIEETQEFAEQRAKRILAVTIDRFHKEMSTERGIAASYFPTEDARKIFCENLSDNIKCIEEITGCDIHIPEVVTEENWDNIQIVGYDPVRRELTRRIFERIFRDIEKNRRKINTTELKKTGENIKNELLNQIKRDGDQICKELKLQNVHSEIRQVMGSLRFRYSYTQNQYFHCAEVGWFAGLLAGELRMDFKKSRRSGMLHDLGKALDHEIDGGHAVIGADFISSRGEEDDVIYAVRAHHHDVTPQHEMDFIVIAADAISGGRPGARRSTVETYTQKVSGLQEISKRHNGVTDVFVLNGGRECRVMVNSKLVDDTEAIKISQQIAKTIEEEMQYPGQIKIVVVRESIVSESTSGRKQQER